MSRPRSVLSPLVFDRILMEKVWGGHHLNELLGLQPPFDGPLGESWELSDYPGNESVVRSGVHAGKTLRELMEAHSEEILGRSRPTVDGRFPLLVKLIDANDDLSVQIHPPDGPKSPTGVGKTEAWFILQTEPGAAVICGLKEGTRPEDFRRDAGTSRVRNYLAEIPVRPGDCILVPAGQTHAIRAGVVLCEIQQTSDVTYRMYDWDRMGLDGKPREIHLQQALEVVDYSLGPAHPVHVDIPPTPALSRERLVSCKYFWIDELAVGEQGGTVPTDGYVHTLTVVSGSARAVTEASRADGVELRTGDTALIPASGGAVEITGLGPDPTRLLLARAL